MGAAPAAISTELDSPSITSHRAYRALRRILRSCTSRSLGGDRSGLIQPGRVGGRCSHEWSEGNGDLHHGRATGDGLGLLPNVEERPCTCLRRPAHRHRHARRRVGTRSGWWKGARDREGDGVHEWMRWTRDCLDPIGSADGLYLLFAGSSPARRRCSRRCDEPCTEERRRPHEDPARGWSEILIAAAEHQRPRLRADQSLAFAVGARC